LSDYSVGLFIFTCILYIWPEARHHLHMLQQNSYFNDRYLAWCRKRPLLPQACLNIGLCIAFFILYNLIPPNMVFVALSLILIALLIYGIVSGKKRGDKVPLVYTWRIWRLIITLGALLVFFFASIWGIISIFRIVFDFQIYRRFFLVLMVAISPVARYLTLAANTINKPIERRIAQGFIDDAKRILGERPGLRVIGVTGSYGKTSVKNILYDLLSRDYEVLMTPESYNTTMGVVRTVRERLSAKHQIFIVEMGAKKPGDIKEICDIVRPEIAILTAIGPMHLETFGSIDKVADTKFELVDAVDARGAGDTGEGASDAGKRGNARGAVFLNYSNEHIRQRDRARRDAKLSSCPTVRYGVDRPANEETYDEANKDTCDETYVLDIWAKDIISGPEGSRFIIQTSDGGELALRTDLLGRHNALNITAAVAVARHIGVLPSVISRRVAGLKPVPHRLELLPAGAKYRIIDDAYNSNPEGAREALDVLGSFPGARILVTPGMVEIGEREEEANRELGTRAFGRCDFIIVVGKNRSGPIEEGAVSAGFDPSMIYVAEDIQDALKKVGALADTLRPGEGPVTALLENDLPDSFM